MRQGSRGYLQNFKSIHAKLKTITVAHLAVEIQVLIYEAARVRRLCTNFQVNLSKNKNFHFGGSFFGGHGGGGLDCGQYQTLTDLAMA